MFCQQCNEREATIHLTTMVGDKFIERDLCEVCGAEFADPFKVSKSFPIGALVSSPAQTLTMMVNNDPRHAKEMCQQCHERPATIHLTQIVGETMTRRDLCAVCGKGLADFLDTRGRAGRFPFLDERSVMLDGLVAKDSRYAKAAYLFVQVGLARAQRMFWEPGKPGHISGAQLLEGLRELAIESYGKRAKAQLNSWGVFKCEDFGEIVFNLVEARLMAKQEEDTKADFQGGYNFDTAFPS